MRGVKASNLSGRYAMPSCHHSSSWDGVAQGLKFAWTMAVCSELQQAAAALH